jgi:hypothetical protein
MLIEITTLPERISFRQVKENFNRRLGIISRRLVCFNRLCDNRLRQLSPELLIQSNVAIIRALVASS